MPRGMPAQFVTCSTCGSDRGWPKVGQCRGCWIRKHPRTRYSWTADLDARLRREYADAKSKAELSAAIGVLAQATGWPRYAISMRAVELGVCDDRRQGWQPHEVEYLQEQAGARSVSAIARKLRRSYQSVRSKAAALRLSYAVRDGYSANELAQVLGVSQHSVVKWIAVDWLRVSATSGRIPDVTVERFLRKHPEAYDLRRVDQAWFKGMLFPRTFGGRMVFSEKKSCVGTAGADVVEFGEERRSRRIARA